MSRISRVAILDMASGRHHQVDHRANSDGSDIMDDDDVSVDDCSCSDSSLQSVAAFGPASDGSFSLHVFSKEFAGSPVYRAIVSCSLAALYHALYCQQQPATLVDANFGVNFLHLVAATADRRTEAAFEPFVYALSNHRAEPGAEDAGGETPLRRALRRGLPRLVRALLRCGARQEPSADAAVLAEAVEEAVAAGDEEARMAALAARHAYEEFPRGGLWAAVQAGDYFLVDRLLGCWCRVRISRPDGESLISFARRVGAGSLIVELLEGSRATLEFVHATLAGDSRKMTQLLANRNVNVDVRDRSHRPSNSSTGAAAACRPKSLRETATAMGHRRRVLRLLPPDRGSQATGRRSNTAGGRAGRPAASSVCGLM